MSAWKRKFIGFLGLLTLCASPVFSDQKVMSTGEAKPLYLAILDLDQVLQQAKTPEGLRVALEAKRAEYQTEISSLEAELRQAYEFLSQEGAALSDVASQEVYEAKRRAFEERVAGVHRQVAERRKELEAFHAEHMGPIQESLGKVIAKISESRGISLVMPRSAAVFREESLDLTLDVIEALNDELPSFEALQIKVASMPENGSKRFDLPGKKELQSPSVTALRMVGEKSGDKLHG